MRLLLKILVIPFILTFTLISLFARFLVVISGALLSGLSVFMFILGVFTVFMEGFRESVSRFVFGFLISPFGLPLLAECLLDKFDGVNYALRDFVMN